MSRTCETNATERPERAVRSLRWWGLATYVVGGFTLLWGVLFSVVGLLAVFGGGDPGGSSSAPLAGAFASAVGAAAGVILLVGAVPVCLLAVVLLLSGRGARRRSRRWWLVGMTLYVLVGLLALVSGELVTLGLASALAVLGASGRTALD